MEDTEALNPGNLSFSFYLSSFMVKNKGKKKKGESNCGEE